MRHFIAAVLLIFTNISFAQESHPLDFFPHHEGDIFEYQIADSYFQNIITKDSLGNDGKYYLETTIDGPTLIDTINYEVRNHNWGGGTYGTLMFKLDADLGDTWIVYSFEQGAIKAEVVSEFSANVFGQTVEIKEINFFEFSWADTTQALYIQAFYLASNFGIIAEFGDPPGDPVYYLRGAKINGKIYGTITSTGEYPRLIPDNFFLFQNYPNPFNPSTLIKYALPHDGFVSLKVYDILGNEVASLVDEIKLAGNYNAEFNGANLASGVYIYRLKVQSPQGGFIRSKKMVLAK